ncbi:MAG: NAD(P)H-dependent oxidoreductase subunit E [Planctomycetes bacterium]|nr:NAD(P)H-dependent oxidoreductase subunit E [Planctomycetota bacterium]
MAWIAKPSSTAKIERRAAPYLTAEMKAEWEKNLLPRYATKHGALMPILHEVQHAHRHVPYQAMIEIAQFLGLKPADVLDTVSFYEEFHTEPVGECVIGICQSIACEMCGHKAILDHVRKRLSLEPHETSDDGKFTLLALECLGSCDTAPAALFNDKLHENLTIDGVDRLIDEAKKSAPRSGHA